MAELSESSVAAVARKVEEARAGQLSLYGLFALLEDLQPVPAELDRARRRRDSGGAVAGVSAALLDSEPLLGNAVTEMKRTLAEDLERALSAEGITLKERGKALDFVEAQLKAAAKDSSQTGAVRRSKLKEKRAQLESCRIVQESREVGRLEKALASQEKEFSGAREQYEQWQAGRVKFGSNAELQACKRRFESLQKAVEKAEAELEAAMCMRRPAAAAAAEESTWSAAAAPAKPKATANGKVAVAQKPVAAAAAAVVEDDDEGFFTVTASKSKQEEEPWQRKTRTAPDRQELEKKKEAAKEAKNAAKRRGAELMADLKAELRGADEAPMPVRSQGAQARQQPMAAQARQPVVAAAQARPGGWQAPAKTVAAHAEPPPDEFPEEEEEEDGTLAEGWEAVWSAEHGCNYYWNTETDAVQWDAPLRPKRPARPPPPPIPGTSAPLPQKKEASSAKAAAANQQRPAAAAEGARDGAEEAARRRATAEAIARARRLARGEEVASGFWEDCPPAENGSEDEGPRLSFECVSAAVAAELGLTQVEVRDFGVSSVTEWRANFSVEEWGRIRRRAVQLEEAKKQQAVRAERERSNKLLEKMANSHGAAPVAKAKAATPKAAAAAKAAAAKGAPKKAAGKKKPEKEKPATADLSAMAHKNRFACAFSDSDDD